MFLNLLELMQQLLRDHKSEFPDDNRNDVEILFQILSSARFDKTILRQAEERWSMEIKYEEGATDDDLRALATEFVRMMKFRNN